MARMFTAETLLRGKAPSSVGARACELGQGLAHEVRLGRRGTEPGTPDQRR